MIQIILIEYNEFEEKNFVKVIEEFIKIIKKKNKFLCFQNLKINILKNLLYFIMF